MSLIKIIVEGKADFKFLLDLSASLGTVLTKDNFVVTGGYCSNWVELNSSNIKKAQAENFKPVLILDANGNYGNRKDEIDSQLLKAGLGGIPYFILPNNGANGNLENLLLNCTNPAHSSIMECFDNYYNCLNKYHQPDLKSKVYSYVDALLPIADKKKAREENRDYNDINIWNLATPELDPLKNFLQAHL